MSERRVPVNFLRTWREGRGSRAASTVAGVGMNRVEEALVCEAMPAPDGMRWWERAWRSNTSRRFMVGMPGHPDRVCLLTHKYVSVSGKLACICTCETLCERSSGMSFICVVIWSPG